MREKMLSIFLMVLVVLFIPIFVTSIINPDFHEKAISQNNMWVKADYGNGTIEIALEDYVFGVVAAKMPANYHNEALKALAVSVRTYVLKKYNENNDFVFNNQLLDYYSDDELKTMWGIDQYAANYSKIKASVDATKGQVITYQDGLIDAIFHGVSIGKTRSALEVWGEDIPYLQETESIEDINSPNYLHQYTFLKTDFIQILLTNQQDLILGSDLSKEVQIIERSQSSYVLKLQIGNKMMSGEEFRRLFSLASSCFLLEMNENEIRITCKGEGHGVGLSLAGANFMALEGRDYLEIIRHYYVGTSVKNQTE